MRLGCLLPMVSLAMIIGGGQSLYTGLKNRNPVEVSIDSVYQKTPDAKWLSIAGGVLDTTNSAYPSTFGVGKATSLYLPLMPPGQDSNSSTIKVLVLTKNKELLDFANEMRAFDKDQTPTPAAKEFLMKNLSKLHVAKTVEGLVQYGIESSGKRDRKLHKLYDNLAGDVLILEEGKRPSVGLGLGMLVAGLALGGILLKSASGKKPPVSGATPPPLPQGSDEQSRSSSPRMESLPAQA